MERNLEPHHSFPLPLETWVIIQSIVALALQELKEQYRVSTFVFTTIQSWEMAEKSCVKRLQKEYRALCKEPVSHVVARPSPNDILEWHYVLEGSEGTPFAGGYYYGKIKFPPEYPYKPPGISMTTPNGRFMTQKKICLSMSDFHPESWNPMWSVSSILTGLLSFMMDNSPTTGSVTTTTKEKQRLAKASLSFNCKNATFRKMFPEYVEKYNQQLSEQSLSEQGSPAPSQEDSRRLLDKEAVISNLDAGPAGFHLWHRNGSPSSSTLICRMGGEGREGQLDLLPDVSPSILPVTPCLSSLRYYMLVMSSFIYLRFLLGSVEVGIPLFVSVSKAQLPGPSPATNGWISVEGHPNALAIIAKMLKSAVYPKCETGDYNDHGLDLQEDFSQFLEEARRHARQGNPQGPSPHGDEAGKGRLSEEKRSKKSWKSTLFSWWKADKKNKPSVEQVPCSRISDPRRGHVSGPIYGSGRRTDSKQRRPTSGPLTSLFNPTRKAETDIPYVSLNQLSSSHSAQAYGPVYLVT
ncbi:hypothetical protein AAG906_029541 [Vitis piasezkii]